MNVSFVCSLFFCQGPFIDESVEMFPAPRTLVEKMKFGNSLQVSSDNRTLAVCGYDAGVSCWDVRTAEKKSSLIGPGATAISFSADGKTIGCAHRVFDKV